MDRQRERETEASSPAVRSVRRDVEVFSSFLRPVRDSPCRDLPAVSAIRPSFDVATPSRAERVKLMRQDVVWSRLGPILTSAGHCGVMREFLFEQLSMFSASQTSSATQTPKVVCQVGGTVARCRPIEPAPNATREIWSGMPIAGSALYSGMPYLALLFGRQGGTICWSMVANLWAAKLLFVEWDVENVPTEVYHIPCCWCRVSGDEPIVRAALFASCPFAAPDPLALEC